MIFYFSATGNSRFAAKTLGEMLGESVREMVGTDEFPTECYDESLGFVFPVYSWGIPVPVLDFIKRIKESFAYSIIRKGGYVWAVMTCGDDVGKTPEMLRKIMKERGLVAKGIWSLEMPNTYVLLPGFDVDPENIEEKKLREAPMRLDRIAREIGERKETTDVVRGGFAWIKTNLIYPLFRRWGVKWSKWHYNSKCIICGRCVRICPYQNISMTERPEGKRPEWGNNCCSCLACYHVCPKKAVDFGSVTVNKGQYRHFLR